MCQREPSLTIIAITSFRYSEPAEVARLKQQVTGAARRTRNCGNKKNLTSFYLKELD